MGISWACASKWVNRWRKYGDIGLLDRSSTPHHQSTATPDEQHREWWALWAELWLYGQRHPEAAHRLAGVQAQTRAAIAAAFEHAGHAADGEVIAIVHALCTGFILYRLAAPDALDAEAFG
jgi:leucine-zipper of insertion element IS481/BetI-type transcriptional repressor, C-terminal